MSEETSEADARARLLGMLWKGACEPGREGADLSKAYPWARRITRFDDLGRYPGLLEEAEAEMGRPLTDEEKQQVTGWLPPRAWWRPGQWDAEADLIEWRAAQTPSFPLMICRGTFGALCGYVGLPRGHVLHGKNHNHSTNLELTEGLSWSGPSEGQMIATGEPPEHWWVGFDCAHLHREYQPALSAADGWMGALFGPWMPRAFRDRTSPRQYVNVNEVRRRTEALALSLLPGLREPCESRA